MVNQRLLRNYIHTHTPPFADGVIALWGNEDTALSRLSGVIQRGFVVCQSGCVVEGGFSL